MKSAYFALVFLVFFGLGAFGQSNVGISSNQLQAAPVVERSALSALPEKLPGVRSATTPQGTLSFASGAIYNTGGFQAEQVVAADLNGDGKADLVVVNSCGSSNACSGDGTVGVLLNDGNGAFDTAVPYTTNGWLTQQVAIGDVNGDGKPDIVVVNQCASNPGTTSCSTTGNVAVLLGNGDGTFQAAVTYDSGGYQSFAVAIADVNGDGKPDLLVVNYCGSSNACSGDGTVAVLLGNGDGTFQSSVTYDTGAAESDAIAVGDVNGDGKPDLIVANLCQVGTCDLEGDESGSVSVLLGKGAGIFQQTANYVPDAIGTNAVAVADVNGDGKLDIAASSSCAGPRADECGTGSVLVFLGNGDETFQTGQSLSLSALGAANLVIADFNGDGNLDLAISSICAPDGACPNSASGPSPSSAGVLLGNGDGTFQAVQYFGSVGSSFGLAPGLAVGDLT